MTEAEALENGARERIALTAPLTAHDRCDVRECGAGAYVRVNYQSGYLLFCGHHFTKLESTATSGSVSVHDERARLDGKRLDVSA